MVRGTAPALYIVALVLVPVSSCCRGDDPSDLGDVARHMSGSLDGLMYRNDINWQSIMRFVLPDHRQSANL